MILVAGLTPAWQQILTFDGLQAGSVNRAVESHWCASGKVINVGTALHHLESPVRTLTMIGGWSGEAIRRQTEQFGLGCRFIPCRTPTRICTTIIDRRSSQVTELVENAHAVEKPDLDAFQAAFREEAATADLVVLSGSLPSATPASIFREMLFEFDGPVVLDVRGLELIESLVCRPLIIKINRDELALTAGRELTSEEALYAAMKELIDRGAQWVVVTDGAGDVLVASESDRDRLAPIKSDVLNPIGCGDCFTAGIARGIHRGEAVMNALTLGLAAAAENLSQLLPARLDNDRVEAIRRFIQVDDIDRPHQM